MSNAIPSICEVTAPISKDVGKGPASTSSSVLRIEWTHVSDTDHGFQATSLAGDTNGDVFTVDVDGSSRLITYFDASEQTTVEIWWDAVTGEGYLIAPNYNGGVKACWDTNQDDVACS